MAMGDASWGAARAGCAARAASGAGQEEPLYAADTLDVLAAPLPGALEDVRGRLELGGGPLSARRLRPGRQRLGTWPPARVAQGCAPARGHRWSR